MVLVSLSRSYDNVPDLVVAMSRTQLKDGILQRRNILYI